MNPLDLALILIAVLVLGAVVLRLVRVVRGDGYGHRPPPASHLPWWAPAQE